MLTFGEAVRRFYGNYTNPEGRAQRSAYWWVQLYQSILFVVMGIVILMAEGGPSFFENLSQAATPEGLTILWNDLGSSGKIALLCAFAFSLINLVPGIMISIRRFHDLGQSGWLVLAFFVIGLLPLFGTLAGIANYVWFAVQGTVGPNRYGPDPLGLDSSAFN